MTIARERKGLLKQLENLDRRNLQASQKIKQEKVKVGQEEISRLLGGKAGQGKENDWWRLIGKESPCGKPIPRRSQGRRHVPLYLCLLRLGDKPSSGAHRKHRRLTKVGSRQSRGSAMDSGEYLVTWLKPCALEIQDHLHLRGYTLITCLVPGSMLVHGGNQITIPTFIVF